MIKRSMCFNLQKLYIESGVYETFWFYILLVRYRMGLQQSRTPEVFCQLVVRFLSVGCLCLKEFVILGRWYKKE